MFLDKDVQGCNITYVFHITDGGYIGRQLNGLTVVLVPHPGATAVAAQSSAEKVDPNVGAARKNVAAYFPKGLSKQTQHDLIGAIYENFMRLGMMNAETHFEPITFAPAYGGYNVSIPAILQIKVRPKLGAGDKQIVLDNLKLDGKRWLLGESIVQSYQDPGDKGWAFSYPEGNGSWTKFKWFWYDRP